MLLKRCFDLVVVISSSPIWLPILLILAIIVRLKLGSSVFFRQTRIGWKERPFEIVKFRTMSDATDETGNLLPDLERLSPFGLWLRSTSLDELPEIWNVMKGEMSLVGPRPLLEHYLPRYSLQQRRRHEVLPGVTGLAQVNGRNGITWEEKFAWDLRYVELSGIWIDIKILIRTIAVTLSREGVSAVGNPTMPEFQGTDSDKA